MANVVSGEGHQGQRRGTCVAWQYPPRTQIEHVHRGAVDVVQAQHPILVRHAKVDVHPQLIAHPTQLLAQAVTVDERLDRRVAPPQHRGAQLESTISGRTQRLDLLQSGHDPIHRRAWLRGGLGQLGSAQWSPPGKLVDDLTRLAQQLNRVHCRHHSSAPVCAAVRSDCDPRRGIAPSHEPRGAHGSAPCPLTRLRSRHQRTVAWITNIGFNSTR